MTVFASPAVTSRERNALTGVGHGDALASEPHWARTAGAWVKRKRLDAAAASTTTAGSSRMVLKRMKRGNDTRAGLVTPAARGSTTPRSARESASAGRAHRASGA